MNNSHDCSKGNWFKKKLSKRALWNSGLVFLFLFFLIILELLLRNYHFFDVKISWTEPDSLICWKYTPGADYWYFDENDHPIVGKINNFGWRDKNWSLEKPENTVRIAVLGDSFVAAFEVEHEQTFLNLAEVNLNSLSQRRFELMNFGRSGFTTTEELLILDIVVRNFSPDMVVLFFFPANDIADVTKHLSTDFNRPFFRHLENGEIKLDLSFKNTALFKLKKIINPIKQNSAIVSLLTERFNLLFSQRKQRPSKKESSDPEYLKTIKKLRGDLSLASATPDSNFVKAYSLNKQLLIKIKEICSELDIEFLLVCINLAAYYPGKENKLLAIDSTFHANYFDNDLSKFAKQNKFDFIGLNSIFRENFNKNKKTLQWSHWNYNGHKLVAQVLRDHIHNFYLNK